LDYSRPRWITLHSFVLPTAFPTFPDLRLRVARLLLRLRWCPTFTLPLHPVHSTALLARTRTLHARHCVYTLDCARLRTLLRTRHARHHCTAPPHAPRLRSLRFTTCTRTLHTALCYTTHALPTLPHVTRVLVAYRSGYYTVLCAPARVLDATRTHTPRGSTHHALLPPSCQIWGAALDGEGKGRIRLAGSAHCLPGSLYLPHHVTGACTTPITAEPLPAHLLYIPYH